MTGSIPPEPRAELIAPDSRMDAYYYAFARTGVIEVDAILSAVASAGKAFHNTDQWADPMNRPYGAVKEGESFEELIQSTANWAAQSFAGALATTRKEGAKTAFREAARVLAGEFNPLTNREPEWRAVHQQLLDAASET